MKKHALLSLLFCLILSNLFAQDKTIDSLKRELIVAKNDSVKSDVLSYLAEIADESEWPVYNEKLLVLSEQKLKQHLTAKQTIFYKTHYASSLNNVGYLNSQKGDMAKAFEYFSKSLKIRTDLGDKPEMANCLNNIAFTFEHQGNIKMALDYYFKSLKINEEFGEDLQVATCLNNISVVYTNQNDLPKALEYAMKSLQIRTKLDDKSGIGLSLNNIGSIYLDQKDTLSAIEYFEKSLKIQEETGDKHGIAMALNNISAILAKQKNYTKALEYVGKCLKIVGEIGDNYGIAFALYNTSDIYYQQKNYEKAIEFAAKSLSISKAYKLTAIIRNSSSILYKAYKAKGKDALALKYYEEYILMRDSINNQDTKKASIKSQLKYEYEKKAAADSVKVAEEKKVVVAQLKQEKTQRFALYGGLALVALFGAFMFNRFRVTQKQKHIIELKEKETQQQKHIIEEKHKEITDSINYAERIQRSFLATEKQLNDNLPDYFVLFKPKDVVSGDFYWSAKLNNGNFALVTADSTGHGVPGAIMSLLNVTSLEKAIEHHTNPADILNHTRQTIIERLKKDGSVDGGKDGMDCSLLAFDFISAFEGGPKRVGDVAAILNIAAANNPVWIIRNKELIEIKPDKMPIGKSERQNDAFTLHSIDLQKGDTIYTLTDGFPDQFGGPKGKKFMSKNLKELLLANSDLPIHQQKELLESAFKNWVGDLEQIDDVTIIGIKI